MWSFSNSYRLFEEGKISVLNNIHDALSVKLPNQRTNFPEFWNTDVPPIESKGI